MSAESFSNDRFQFGSAIHRKFNRVTRDDWDRFADHRRQLMDLVKRATSEADQTRNGPGDLTKCAVLGAGNCNDLELSWLLSQFSEVHLVDLDAESVEFAKSKVDERAERLQLHAPFDIAAPLTDERITPKIAEGSPTAVSDCDLVISSCVLSQLMLTVNERADRQQLSMPLLPTLQCVRRGHLRTVMNMLRVGGSAALAFDFVSSDTVPELRGRVPLGLTPKSLQSLSFQLVASNNFFSGINPAIIFSELNGREDVRLVHQTAPWIWTVGPRRYLVVGLVAQRIA